MSSIRLLKVIAKTVTKENLHSFGLLDKLSNYFLVGNMTGYCAWNLRMKQPWNIFLCVSLASSPEQFLQKLLPQDFWTTLWLILNHTAIHTSRNLFKHTKQQSQLHKKISSRNGLVSSMKSSHQRALLMMLSLRAKTYVKTEIIWVAR